MWAKMDYELKGRMGGGTIVIVRAGESAMDGWWR